MALPKINAPTYDLKLYSDGRTVKFRPFLVKEQKLLLMAAEEGKPADIMNALGTIVKIAHLRSRCEQVLCLKLKIFF